MGCHGQVAVDVDPQVSQAPHWLYLVGANVVMFGNCSVLVVCNYRQFVCIYSNMQMTSRDALLEGRGFISSTGSIDLGVFCIKVRMQFHSMSLNKSAVYRRNRIGPITDPCGTPHSDEEVKLDPL